MARLAYANHSNPQVDLSRLLARMQKNILHADPEQERRLRLLEYERIKAGTLVEHARTLLTRVEQEALNIKIQSRRQEMQADLNRKREIFDQIIERLRELEEVAVNSDEDDSGEGEDLLAGIIHTPSDSMDSREQNEEESKDAQTGIFQPEQRERDRRASEARASATSEPATRGGPGTSIIQALRSRNNAPVDQKDAAESSARSQLFDNRKGAATTEVSTTATTEAILDHQRAEQDKLTESLLQMATSLKFSSRAFATSLEEEKDVLKAAGAGLEKGERGIESATGRMSRLRKMSEGSGWWGRMKLYALIYGLMFLLILLVFGPVPKLRF